MPEIDPEEFARQIHAQNAKLVEQAEKARLAHERDLAELDK